MDQIEIKPPNPEGKSSGSLHFRYIVGILVAIIIFLCTKNFGNQDKLANALNFALGLTSMVLAILAIVYAFVANNAFAGTVSKIVSAAESIKAETVQLDQSLRKVEAVVDSIPKSLAKIEGGIDKANQILESQPKAELPPPAKQDDAKVLEYAKAVIDRFMTSTSWNGIKVLYFCLMAAKEKKPYNLRDWTTKDPSLSFDYAYGFLVAAGSAGFVFLNDDNGVVRIHSLPEIVSERLMVEVNNRMTSGVRPKDWAAQVKIINNFFPMQAIYERINRAEPVQPANPPSV